MLELFRDRADTVDPHVDRWLAAYAVSDAALTLLTAQDLRDRSPDGRRRLDHRIRLGPSRADHEQHEGAVDLGADPAIYGGGHGLSPR